MGRTPTLQSLALKAHEYFGEDGDSFEESIPSSLDVVVAGYAEAADPADVAPRASTELRRHLESQGRPARESNVDEFAQMAVTYLQTVYPNAHAARNGEERRALSHLFWGHLVQARFALGGQGEASSRALPSRQQRTVRHTITCSCGAEHTSGDEEDLYRFARMHAAQQHQEPHTPSASVKLAASSGTTSPEAIVQRWEEEVVNRGDLTAIDDLSPAGPAEELKERVAVLRTAFPDLHVTIEDIVVDADEVALRSTLQGTHQGEFRGVAPTGKQVTVESFEFFRIEDDKIVEHRGTVEEVRLLEQLGAMPEQLRV